VLLAAVGLLAGCGGGQERVLTVTAAASLTEAFTVLGEQFEAQHPGTDVRFNFAGSSALAQQIIAGAPADVFASADRRQLQRVVDEGLTAGDPQAFATNSLTIAVPRGNPGGVASLGDLADPGLRLVVCAPQVPCGTAARELEQVAGVRLRPDSEESDVKAVLAKVQVGEADAGLVYVTDVRTAGGGVEAIAIPQADVARNEYAIAVLADAPNPEPAREFVDLVTSERGRQVLRDAGFGTP
jgi:molybdate transport system substrate-binding protein